MRHVRAMTAAALLLAGSLAACASGEAATEGSGGTVAAKEGLHIGVAYAVGGRGDRSLNDSAFAGASWAADELGGEVRDLSPNADASNRADLLTQLADEGYNPIIAVGSAYGDHIGDVVAQYPETTFAIVDSSVVEIGADNLTGLLFADEESSFLAGVAAALKTETDHVGFIGGVEIRSIQTYEAGYVAGVAAVNPDIEVDVQYISPVGDFSGFVDAPRGQIVAQGMFDGGADIVYHAAGGAGLGVFRAAAASEGLAIGAVSDQYETVDDEELRAVIMTSTLKRVDRALQGFLTCFVHGSVPGGEDVVDDLETRGVDLATSGGRIDDIADQIDEFRQQILAGEIEVPTIP